MTLFHGLSAFPITPADSRGRVDTEALGRLLDRLRLAKVDSVGLLGSTGGYAYLARDERRRAVAAAATSLGGSIPLIVGVGALRTDEAVALARDAAERGADALLLAPMSYTPLTDEEVFRHFRAVAGATELPLCIYNNPATTHFSFSPALLARLAEVPNIKAVKMPLPKEADFTGELAGLRGVLPEGFAIGYSGDWGAADALIAGADAWYSVVGGLLPVPALQLVRAAEIGDAAEVRRVDALFQPLWSLFKAFGSIRVMYAGANILSLCDVAPPLPILPLDDAARERLAAVLAALNAAT
jgi:4-hydroxy-tetrahydrodipicolinate synthase